MTTVLLQGWHFIFIFTFFCVVSSDFLHTVIEYQVFLSNTNYLHTVVWFQVFLAITNNYILSCNYFYLMIVICLHTLLLFQETYNNS